MKILTLALFLGYFTSVVSANTNVEQERKKCDQITCADLKGEDEYRCRQQSKSCYLRVFETQMVDWKAQGIPRRVRADVLKSLEGASEQNKQVSERLKKEIELIDLELKQIAEQIEAVKSLRQR